METEVVLTSTDFITNLAQPKNLGVLPAATALLSAEAVLASHLKTPQLAVMSGSDAAAAAAKEKDMVALREIMEARALAGASANVGTMGWHALAASGGGLLTAQPIERWPVMEDVAADLPAAVGGAVAAGTSPLASALASVRAEGYQEASARMTGAVAAGTSPLASVLASVRAEGYQDASARLKGGAGSSLEAVLASVRAGAHQQARSRL
jgi:hypothetical protein